MATCKTRSEEGDRESRTLSPTGAWFCILNIATYVPPKIITLLERGLLSHRDGDVYGALRDCHATLRIDTQHVKAHLRLHDCVKPRSICFVNNQVFFVIEWCCASWN